MKHRKNKNQTELAADANNAFMPNPYDHLGSWNGNPLLNPIMPFEGAEEPTQDADDL